MLKKIKNFLSDLIKAYECECIYNYCKEYCINQKDAEQLFRTLKNPPAPDEDLKKLMKGGDSEFSS